MTGMPCLPVTPLRQLFASERNTAGVCLVFFTAALHRDFDDYYFKNITLAVKFTTMMVRFCN